MNIEELVDRATVFAHLRQQHLERYVGDRIWWLDPQNGKARLVTRDRSWMGPLIDVQILGTEDREEWIWAWNNPLSFLFEHTFAIALALRARGHSEGIAELTTGRLRRDALVNGRVLGAVATALGGFGGYVIHGAGEVTCTFLVPASYPAGEEEDRGNLNLLARTCSDLVTSGETLTSARHLMAGAFDALGLVTTQASEDAIAGTNARGQTLTATFAGRRFSLRTAEPPARAPAADGPFFAGANVALALDKGRLVVRPAGALDIFAHMRALRFAPVLALYLGADRILMARVEDAGPGYGDMNRAHAQDGEAGEAGEAGSEGIDRVHGHVVVALHGAFARESSREPTTVRYLGPLPLDEARALVRALDIHLGLPRRAIHVTDADLDEHPELHLRTFVQVDGTWTTGHEKSALGRSWLTLPDARSLQRAMHEHGSSPRSVLAFFHAGDHPVGYGHMNVFPSELEVLEMTPAPEIAHADVEVDVEVE